MSPESEQDDDWGALQNALADTKNEEDDEPGIDVLSNSGLLADSSGAAKGASNELPYVTLLNAAVAMVKTGKLSMEEYAAGVRKLDIIADNALKIYSIPAVKKDLPGKLTESQNAIVGALEGEIHRMKEGLGMLLRYPQTMASDDLEVGHQTTVSALNAMAKIQKDALVESEIIKQKEKEEKARRAQKAAEVE